MEKCSYIRYIKLLLLPVILLAGCSERNAERPSAQASIQEVAVNAELYHRTVKNLTDVIVYDIFSPPVASRIYLYPNIAAYEVLAAGSADRQSLSGQLRELEPVPALPGNASINIQAAALFAFQKAGKALVFSENRMDDYEKELRNELFAAGLTEEVLEDSRVYGHQVADHILAWADKDNYKQSRTFPKYTIQDDESSWQPTPPDYMEGIEPSWNRIRPMLLDSASQFRPEPPTPYSMKKTSTFYKELMEVYETSNTLTDDQKAIARFWDCNPYVSHHKGHAMFATKKITPGGHWIGITRIAATGNQSDLAESVEAYTRVSIALFDGFISCWDEKWRSVLIRPETVINRYVDEDWVPLLQTPPFPEYTSGHSVISTAAAVTLTDLYGDTFVYTDSTEQEYGLPSRDFSSFMEASGEAAISRLYGGIHYMPAIANGVEQGKNVGNFVVNKIKTSVK